MPSATGSSEPADGAPAAGAMTGGCLCGAVRYRLDGPLGRDASAQAHQHEFEADAFALRLIRRMGQPDDTPVVLFQHLPPVKASATHPSSSQRLVQLRTLN